MNGLSTLPRHEMVCEGGLKVDYVRWLAARRDSVLASSSTAREIARVNGPLSTES